MSENKSSNSNFFNDDKPVFNLEELSKSFDKKFNKKSQSSVNTRNSNYLKGEMTSEKLVDEALKFKLSDKEESDNAINKYT